MENKNSTPSYLIYDKFLAKITDDMYMELSPAETESMLEELLVNAIYRFEFPRVRLDGYVPSYVEEQETYSGVESNNKEVPAYIMGGGEFPVLLSDEEMNILATYMVVEWLGQQLATVENVRMKYSGNDYRFTSQANHMAKLLNLRKDYEREGFHLQRLYKRRAPKADGSIGSTMDIIMAPLEGSKRAYGN